MTPRQIAKILGIKLDFDELEKKGDMFALLQVKRRTRYYCFSMKTKVTNENNNVRVPKKLINYFETNSGFEGWHNFGVTWDVKKSDPLTIFFRDFSVNQEWDATIRRVVPELPIDRVLRQKGPETDR